MLRPIFSQPETGFQSKKEPQIKSRVLSEKHSFMLEMKARLKMQLCLPKDVLCIASLLNNRATKVFEDFLKGVFHSSFIWHSGRKGVY